MVKSGAATSAACVQTIALKPNTTTVTNPAINPTGGAISGTDQRGVNVQDGKRDIGAYESGAVFK